MENLQKLIENGGWLPIEHNAKKHQDYQLGKDDDVGVYAMHWRDEQNCFCYTWNQTRCKPTHYMPLDQPERMAKVIEVLAGALDNIYNSQNLYTYVVDRCIRAYEKAEKIAGGN